MATANSTIVAVKQTVFSDLGDEVAILNLNSGEYYGLNQVGAFIWDMIQEPRTLEQICSAVEREFEVTHERCASDLSRLVDELSVHGLIAVTEHS